MKKQKLTEEQAIGKIDEYFNCQMCFNIVENPVRCGECENIFCRDCIDNWKK